MSEESLESKARAALNFGNRLLSRLNLRVETLTAQRAESARVAAAVGRGDFERSLYALPPSFQAGHFNEILAALPQFADRFASFDNPAKNEVGYSFDNGYYSSPDTEVLYTMVRTLRPARIVEIGCGNSTRVVRQALIDGLIECDHRAIDPNPREEIGKLANVVLRQPIETVDPVELATSLKSGDILFIDTSHEVTPCNDVAYIYGRLLPLVGPGVIVHVHDIFLPFEYPLTWVKELGLHWGEQYIVQAMLTFSSSWDVVWPGYYLERTLPDFASHFPRLRGESAKSLWLRRMD